MAKKNLKVRGLRSVILTAAAATVLMGSMSAFAAEDDVEESVGILWEDDLIAGTVTAVDSDSITVRTFGMMEDIGFGLGMPQGGPGQGMPDGQTPPELPEGERPELPEGEMPEPPEGEMPEPPEGERPEPPEGGMPELPEGGMPELPEGTDDLMGRPEGMPQGGMPQGGSGVQSGSEVVVNINSSTVITKEAGDESADISDITAGANVLITLDGDTAISIIVIG